MKNFFLADDDDDDRLLFEEAIRELNLDVNLSIAQNGDDLLKMLEETSIVPDVIIMDLNMPKKSGFECVADLRENPKFNNVPLVILSTSYSKDAIEIAYQLGADRYLSKPNSFDLFKKAVLIIAALKREGNNTLLKEEFVLKLTDAEK